MLILNNNIILYSNVQFIRWLCMQGKIFYHEDLHFFEITFQGPISKEVLVNTRTKAIQIAYEKNCMKFLSNLENAFIDFSIHQIWTIPGEMEKVRVIFEKNKYKLKGAIYSKYIDENLAFLEDVFNNNGLNLKIFQNKDHSIK